MPEYVDQATVKKRATVNGWRFIADRDHDGVVSDAESDAVDYAIAWAGRRIDEVLNAIIQVSDARSQQVDWLKDVALDLAVYRLFTNGGDDAPKSIQDAYKDAKESLKRVAGGMAVPGLVMAHPRPSAKSYKVPRSYRPR